MLDWQARFQLVFGSVKIKVDAAHKTRRGDGHQEDDRRLRQGSYYGTAADGFDKHLTCGARIPATFTKLSMNIR